MIICIYIQKKIAIKLTALQFILEESIEIYTVIMKPPPKFLSMSIMYTLIRLYSDGQYKCAHMLVEYLN